MRLALDQGGQSSRAVVFAPDGRIAASAQVAVGTRRAAGGIVEQDAEEIVASLASCIAEVAAVVPPKAWRAAGLACQRSSVVGWDRASGAARTPVLSWMDTRAAAAFDEVTLDPERVRALTGLPPSPHYGATKLRWLLAHAEPGGAFGCGPLASFLLHRLLDERPYRVAHTLAQRTLLYDVVARDWSDELLSAFGLARATLPTCVDDCSTHGTLHGVPLTVCAGDQNLVPYAAGDPAADTLYLNLGTGAFALRPVAATADVPDRLLLAPLDGPPGRRGAAAEGTVNGAAAAIAWYEQRTGVPFPWDGLMRVDPAVAPLFVNSVGELGSPFWRTGVPPRFEPQPNDTAAGAYAVVESIAFLVRANFESLPRAARVVATGGLAQQAFMRALLARVLRVPITAGPLDATAHGVASLLGGVTGARAAAHADDASADGSDARLEDRYGRWCSLLS